MTNDEFLQRIALITFQDLDNAPLQMDVMEGLMGTKCPPWSATDGKHTAWHAEAFGRFCARYAVGFAKGFTDQLAGV